MDNFTLGLGFLGDLLTTCWNGFFHLEIAPGFTLGGALLGLCAFSFALTLFMSILGLGVREMSTEMFRNGRKDK